MAFLQGSLFQHVRVIRGIAFFNRYLGFFNPAVGFCNKNRTRPPDSLTFCLHFMMLLFIKAQLMCDDLHASAWKDSPIELDTCRVGHISIPNVLMF